MRAPQGYVRGDRFLFETIKLIIKNFLLMAKTDIIQLNKILV